MSQHFSCFIFKAKQKNNLVEVTYLVSNDKAEYPMNATEGQLSLWEKAEICAKQKFEVERSGRSNLPFRFSYETRELDEDRKLIIAHVKRYFSDVHWTSVEIWHLKIDNQGEIKEQIAEKISFLSDLHQL